MLINYELRKCPQLAKAMKAKFFEAYRAGMAVQLIAIKLLIACSTSYKWVKQFKKKGKEALQSFKRGRKVGSGRILSPKEEKMTQRLIQKFLPSHFEINFSTWTRKAIVELIRLKFKKVVAERTMGDYLKRWNFSPQRPTRQAYQRDPLKVTEWLTSTFQKIKEKAQKMGALIFFGDEVGVHSESFNARSYSPKGITPTVPTTGSRLCMNVIAAVTNTGIMRYMTYCKTMNCKMFISFMKQLIKSAKGTMVFLVVDNLKVHHGKMVITTAEYNETLGFALVTTRSIKNIIELKNILKIFHRGNI